MSLPNIELRLVPIERSDRSRTPKARRRDTRSENAETKKVTTARAVKTAKVNKTTKVAKTAKIVKPAKIVKTAKHAADSANDVTANRADKPPNLDPSPNVDPEPDDREFVNTGKPIKDSLTNYPFVFSRRFGNGGMISRCYKGTWSGCLDSLDGIEQMLKKYNNWYETFDETGKVKPYLDYEVKRCVDKGVDVMTFRYERKIEELKTIKYLKTATQRALETLGCDVKADDIKITNGSGFRNNDTEYKVSFHVVVDSNWYFAGSKNAKVLAIVMKEQASSQETDETQYSNFIDQAVYISPQHMRAIYSCKVDKHGRPESRPLEPVNDANKVIKEPRVADYLITCPDKMRDEIDVTAYAEKLAKKKTIVGRVRNITRNIKKGNPDRADNLYLRIVSALAEFMPSAIFERESDGYHTFNYDHTIHNCPITGEHHDKQGIYAYVTEDSDIMCGCHSEKCKRQKRIGRMHEVSIFAKKDQIDELQADLTATRIPKASRTVKSVKAVKPSRPRGAVGKQEAESDEDEPQDDRPTKQQFDSHIDVNVSTLLPLPKANTTNDHRKVQKHIREFVENPEHKALCIASHCGSGKTHVLQEEIIDRYDRVLFLSHRRTFAADICRRFDGVRNYLEYDYKTYDDMRNTDKLIISVESLHKLFIKEGEVIRKFKRYDLIVIDESESIISQFYSPTVSKNVNSTLNFNVFFHKFVLRTARKIVALDAHLDAKTMGLLKEFKPLSIKNNYHSKMLKRICILKDKRTKMVHRKNLDDNGEVTIGVPKYNSKDHERYFLKQIEKALNKDFKVVVPTLSATFGDTCKRYVQGIFGDKKSVIFHRADGDDTNDVMFDDINGKAGWVTADLLIYSPKVTAGVDFSLDHFDCMFAYITNTADQESFVQMIGRVRKLKQLDVLCLVDPKLYAGTDSNYCTYDMAKTYYEYIDKSVKLERRQDFDGVVGKDGEVTVHDQTDYKVLYAELQVYEVQKELNKYSHNYITGLDMLLRKFGDKLYFKGIEDEGDVVLKQEVKRKKAAERLAEVRDIDDATRHKLVEKSVLSEAENLELEKYDLCEKYGITRATKEFLECHEKAGAKYENMLGLLIEQDIDPKLDDYNTKKELLKRETIRKLLKVLGVRDVLEEKTLDKDAFDDETKFAFITDEVMKAYELESTQTANKVQSILRLYGLNLRTHSKRVGRDKNRKTIISNYTITVDTYVGNLLYMYMKSSLSSGLSNNDAAKIIVFNDFEDLVRPILDVRKVPKQSMNGVKGVPAKIPKHAN